MSAIVCEKVAGDIFFSFETAVTTSLVMNWPGKRAMTCRTMSRLDWVSEIAGNVSGAGVNSEIGRGTAVSGKTRL